MKLSENQYVFFFAIIVCLVCGVLLSSVSEGLRKKQELNADLDVKKNILKAVALREPVAPKATPHDILEIYNTKIQEMVLDQDGNIVEGKKPSEVGSKDKNLHPLYIYKEGDQIISYAFPVVGQGLWSTLYGYVALEADLITIRGITFYKHGETPGLGGEIEKDWFQNNFKGKKIWSMADNKFSPIIVVKGKASEVLSGEKVDHAVDGITAATITGNGVTELMERNLKYYEPYFSKLRKI